MRCPACQIKTHPVTFDWMYLLYKGKTEVTLTQAEATQDAAAAWNRRALALVPSPGHTATTTVTAAAPALVLVSG